MTVTGQFTSTLTGSLAGKVCRSASSSNRLCSVLPAGMVVRTWLARSLIETGFEYFFKVAPPGAAAPSGRTVPVLASAGESRLG